MRLIVGLGNPGKKYEKTRHNIGFKVVDYLADRKLVKFRRMFLHSASYAKFRASKAIVRIIKPANFMNHSGESVYRVMKYWKMQIKDLIVVYDDAVLDLGNIKIRSKGSSGSHNGMQSIINCLGSDQFARVRIGIGPLPNKITMTDFVLGNFDSNEDLQLEKVVDRAVDAVESLLSVGIQETMNRYNNRFE